ncbi:MAG: PHP domain-containing protein, partial [Chitinophagales bacterium]|nr:PHP domain-containing protein [Chitinophagales bacterium]
MYLNCHTYYSFKFGALSTEDLLAEAQSKGVSKFVLSDINNTSAILDFHRLAKKYNVQPVAGIDFRNGVQQKFIGIAKNHEGFFELNNFLSKCLHEVKESMTARETEIPDLAPSFQNAFIVYPFKNVERNPVLHEHLIRDSTHSSSGKVGVGLSDLNRLRFSPWKYHPEKLVALAPVTFRNKTDFNTHRLLRAIDRNIVLSKLELHEQALPDEVMMSEEELCRYYKDFPHIISNTKKLLDECEPIDFEFGKNKNKKTFTGSAAGDSELLRKLCTDNLEYRYPKKETHIIERFNHEIKMITELGFASYFLINWDIVRYAQH